MQHKITTSQSRFLFMCPLPLIILVSIGFWILDPRQSSLIPQMNMAENFNRQTPISNPNLSAIDNQLSYHKEADAKKVTWHTMPFSNSVNSETIRLSDISLYIPSEYIARTSRVIGNTEILKRKQQLLRKAQNLVAHNNPLRLSETKKEHNFHTNPSSIVDLEQLEEIMIQLSSSQINDIERTQLNELLETALDIQHPRRVTKRVATSKNAKVEAYFKHTFPVCGLGSEALPTSYFDKNIGFSIKKRKYKKTKCSKHHRSFSRHQ